jgi:hypothetical protein
MKAETSNHPQDSFDRLIPLIAIALLLVFLPGCKTLTSKAKGKASNIGCKADIGLVKGELDAGVRISVTVKNVGQAGFINIKPELSTSEGEWTRSQDLHFDAGESMTLTYFFDEPTIMATGIQCRIGVYPKAD